MSIWVNSETKVVVQGITGKEGRFHSEKCREYGTKIVAGVTPGKAGQDVDGVPVFNTVEAAVAETGANASLRPTPFSKPRTPESRWWCASVKASRHEIWCGCSEFCRAYRRG